MLFLVYAPISKRASRMQRAFLASFHPTKNQKERNNNKKKRQEIDKIVGEKQQAKLMRRHGRLKLPSQPLRNKKKREWRDRHQRDTLSIRRHDSVKAALTLFLSHEYRARFPPRSTRSTRITLIYPPSTRYPSPLVSISPSSTAPIEKSISLPAAPSLPLAQSTNQIRRKKASRKFFDKKNNTRNQSIDVRHTFQIESSESSQSTLINLLISFFFLFAWFFLLFD